MATVCQKCGVTGYVERLIYCSQCHLSAEHGYCLDKLPKADDKDVTWSCEECVPRVTKQSSLNKLSSRLVRRSSRNPRSARAAQIFQIFKKRKRDNINLSVAEAEMPRWDVAPTLQPSQPYMKDVLPKPAQPTGDCSPPSEENKSSHSSENIGVQELKKQRMLMLEDGDSSDEEAECVKVRPSEVGPDAGNAPMSILSHQPSTEAQPTSDYSPPSEENSSHSYGEKIGVQKLKKQRTLILEDGGSSDEEAECVKVRSSEVGQDAGNAQMSILSNQQSTEAQPTSDYSPPSEENSSHSCGEKIGVQKLKKQRTLILEDGGSSDEEAECVKVRSSEVGQDAGNAPMSILFNQQSTEAQPTSDCSAPSGENRSSHSCGEKIGVQKLKKRRTLILEDGGSSDEEAECVKVRPSEVGQDAGNAPMSILSHQPSTECHSYAHAQPIIDPVWRGCFDICNEKYGTVIAHISSKACLKVFEGANALPPLLRAEMLPRVDVWPKSFSSSAPTDDNIALYFFPGSDREERIFDGLVHYIIEQDLALKAVIDNAELLIFSSCQLPPQYWRFRGKYYLWGVFRARKDSPSHKPADQLLIRNSSTECVMSMSANDVGSREGVMSMSANDVGSREGVVSMSANDMGSREGRNPVKIWHMQSPLSPLSTSCSYGSDSPHSPSHQKSMFWMSEAVSSRFSKPVLPDNTTKSGVHEWDLGAPLARVEEKEGIEAYDLNLSHSEAQPLLDAFNTTHKDNNVLITPCLELFPLRVEDIAVVTRVGRCGVLDLELGLGRSDGGRSPGCQLKMVGTRQGRQTSMEKS